MTPLMSTLLEGVTPGQAVILAFLGLTCLSLVLTLLVALVVGARALVRGAIRLIKAN